jgi:hypothetical protein
MQRLDAAVQALRDRLAELGSQLISHLPELVAALLITLAGWLAGRWLRRMTVKVGERLYRRLERAERAPDPDAAPRSSILVHLVGNVVLWSTLALFATVAVDVAGFDAVVTWLGRLVQYLPNLLLGLLIIVAGYLLSGAVRAFVGDALASANVSQRVPLARGAQLITIAAAVIIGIDQMGVRVALITTVLSIMLAGFLGGLSLAFGLGARSLVANLVGAHQARRYMRLGERARIGDMAGEVIELTPTGIVLASELGRVHVPAARFHEVPVIVSAPEESHG